MNLNDLQGMEASPYASVAKAKDVSGLQKIIITIGSVDLFRDEVEDYVQRLMAVGVSTQLSVFPGVYHGGQMFMPGAEVSQHMINNFMVALKNVLTEL